MPGTKADYKTKVQNIFNCSSASCQPKLKLISEQKVDAAFRLPASQQTRARPVSSQGAASSVAGAAYSVLIVDDNVDSRELQSMALEKLGHAVKGANDGVEGIALALEDDFDVALVDIGLPIVDGYEVARRIRAEKKEHRPALIAVTGYGRDSDRERALQAGFDAHLVKPVKQAALLATIDHAVRKRRGAQSRSGT